MKANTIDGKIIIGVPKYWENPPVNNLRDATEGVLYTLGFRDLVIPTITETQYLGELYKDTIFDVYTYKVIEKTQEEIDYDVAQNNLLLEAQLDLDDFATLEDKYEEDGKILYKRIKHRIRRLLANGTITLAQFNTVRRFLRPAILPLTTGDWDIAKENVDALTVPTNVKLLAILNKVKELINDYITKNNIV